LISAGFAVIVAREIAGGIVVDQLVTDDSVTPAANAAWSISTSLMAGIATTIIVFGVLFAIAGWLGSPTGSARATRRFAAPALRDYAPYVYAGLAIVVCIYFLSAPTQNLRSFLTALILAAFAAFGIHELRRGTATEFPDVTYDDYFGDAKERVAGAVKSANLGEKASRLREGIAGPGGEEEAPTTVISEDDARLERLERLAALHERGVLNDEEFAAEKARVLGSNSRES
jgi:hypothetical protein